MTSTNSGLISGGLMTMSLAGNYLLWKKLDDFKKVQEQYSNMFTILEPILTKIVDGKKLSNSDIEDVKKVREILKFKTIK